MSWTPPIALDRSNIAEAISLLRAPFPPSQIEWRVGSTSKTGRGMALCYIDARAVRRRLNKVLGEWNWRNAFRVDGAQMICEIALRIEGEWVTKSDGAYAGSLGTSGKPDAKEEQRLEMDGKGAFSTALKRAAVCWGVGEYLYDLPSPWVSLDQYKAIEKSEMAALGAVVAKPYEEWKKNRKAAEKAAEASEAPLSPPSTPPVDNVAQEPAPTNDVADHIAVIVGRMDAAANEAALAACAEDMKKLNITDENLSKAAKLAWARNAKRLGVIPAAATKKKQ